LNGYAPFRFGVKRTFSKGPVAEMRALAELTSRAGGGTRFKYEVEIGLVPTRLRSDSIQVGILGARRFRRAFENMTSCSVGSLIR